MNLVKAVLEVECSPSFSVYAKSLYPEAEAVIVATDRGPGDEGFTLFGHGLLCHEYLRHYRGEDGDPGDQEQVFWAIEARCAALRMACGVDVFRPAPTDSRALAELFFSDVSEWPQIARFDLAFLARTVHHLRQFNRGTAIPLSSERIARRIHDHVCQVLEG
jgi:hypothetical protein